MLLVAVRWTTATPIIPYSSYYRFTSGVSLGKSKKSGFISSRKKNDETNGTWREISASTVYLGNATLDSCAAAAAAAVRWSIVQEGSKNCLYPCRTPGGGAFIARVGGHNWNLQLVDVMSAAVVIMLVLKNEISSSSRNELSSEIALLSRYTVFCRTIQF